MTPVHAWPWPKILGGAAVSAVVVGTLWWMLKPSGVVSGVVAQAADAASQAGGAVQTVASIPGQALQTAMAQSYAMSSVPGTAIPRDQIFGTPEAIAADSGPGHLIVPQAPGVYGGVNLDAQQRALAWQQRLGVQP